MEVGHYKVGAIIQARLGSTRLPNKVLLPISTDKNRTLLSMIIDSIKSVPAINNVVVASSLSEENNSLETYLEEIGTPCFRGEENDVLSRYDAIVQEYDFDYVLRFTGDNPIIDGFYLKEFIQNFIDQELDYSCSVNLPLGCNFEMMRSEELLNAYKHTHLAYDKEHVTPYIKRNANKKQSYVFKGYQAIKGLRLTIDYPNDYAFVQTLCMMLTGSQMTLKSIHELITNNQWLLEINTTNFQKNEFASLNEEVNCILPLVEKLELTRLTNHLNKLILSD